MGIWENSILTATKTMNYLFGSHYFQYIIISSVFVVVCIFFPSFPKPPLCRPLQTRWRPWARSSAWWSTRRRPAAVTPERRWRTSAPRWPRRAEKRPSPRTAKTEENVPLYLLHPPHHLLHPPHHLLLLLKTLANTWECTWIRVYTHTHTHTHTHICFELE